MGDRDSSGGEYYYFFFCIQFTPLIGVEDNAILDADLLKKHVSATKYKDLLDSADQAVTDIKNASKYVKIITVGDLRKVPDAFWTSLDPVLSAALKETFIQGNCCLCVVVCISALLFHFGHCYKECLLHTQISSVLKLRRCAKGIELHNR
jgi:hypothetical protein